MTSASEHRVVGRGCAALLLLAQVLGCSAYAASNKAPTVAITAPKSGATFAAPATIAIAATATDVDGTIARVDFYLGTTLLASRTVAPYAATATNLLGGTYSLTAIAIDNKGATKTSSAVTVTVTGARLSITGPAAGSVVTDTSVAISGVISEADTTVVVDGPFGSQLGAVSGNTFQAVVPIVAGPNALRVTATRRDRTFDSATIDVTGHPDPLLVFTAPAVTTFDAPATIPLAVDALSPAGAIAKVDFLRDGVPLASVTAPPYQATWSGVGSGSHVVTAVATDERGRTRTLTLPLVIKGPNVAPAVQLTSPAAGANFTAPAGIPVSASASDSDGSVTKVEFLRDGAVIGVTNVAPYAMTWSAVQAGTYALAARATDDRAAVTTSVAVSVTVKPANLPPTVRLSAPTEGATFAAPATIALAADAADSDGSVARVDFYQGTMLVASTTASPFVASWANVPSGTYVLTARATDNAGASTVSAPVGVRVAANAAPTIALTRPSPNSHYAAPATITLEAAAGDSDGAVARVDFYRDGTLIGSKATVPYVMTWQAVPSGDYVLTAKATDDGGAVSTSAAVMVNVSAPTLTIEAPLDGAAIDSDKVNVTGQIDSTGVSGVTVNGTIAAIHGDRFYANDVTLAAGANILTATLSRLDGAAATRSIAVTSSGANRLEAVVGPTQGLAPLTTTFEMSSRSDVDIVRVDIDANGDGTFDQTLTAAPWSSTVTYGGSGKVDLTLRVTFGDGVIVSSRYPIVIDDRAFRDQQLRAVWSGMTTALAGGDKAGALRYMDASLQQRYAPAIDVLLPSMATIVGSFSDPHTMTLTNELGEYAVTRLIDGEQRVFLIYFGRNGDGLWRIGSM